MMQKFLKRNKLILVTAAVLLIAAVILLCLFLTNRIPDFVKWEEKSINAEDGLKITLHDKSVSAIENGKVVWNSSGNYLIQDMLYCDIDRDNENELLLLLWKKGVFGIYKPFWIEEDKDKDKYSQHIFIYEKNTAGEYFHSIWGASEIGMDAVRWRFDDEKKYLMIEDKDKDVTCWECPGWGLQKVDSKIDFIAVGDNLIHKPLYMQGLKDEYIGFDFLFDGVKEQIRDADLAAINNETILVDDPSRYSDYPRFGTPLLVGEAIVDAGFDIVTAATNHALDQGIYGINTTKKFYEAKDIRCLGIHTSDETECEPYEIINKNGIRLALFNYTYGTNGIKMPVEQANAVQTFDDEKQIRSDIKKAKASSDIVIVFAHWGTEYNTEIDDFQKKWRDVFYDEGVDVVIGTHPHVLQSYEMYKSDETAQREMLIYYSLGNYISAQKDDACKIGGIASFRIQRTFDGIKVTKHKLGTVTTAVKDGVYGVESQFKK